jgi:hypothetical protein
MKRFKSGSYRNIQAIAERGGAVERTREPVMRQFLSGVLVAAMLLVGYGETPARAEPPSGASTGSVVPGSTVPNLTPTAPSLATVSPLSSRPPLFQMAPPSVAEGQIGAAHNVGPVTGYGPGGMGHIPSSPANAPYR